MKKRIISLLLALSMMISLVPVSALANTGGGIAPLAAGDDLGEELVISEDGKSTADVCQGHTLTVIDGDITQIDDEETTNALTTTQVMERAEVTIKALEKNGGIFKEWKIEEGSIPDDNFTFWKLNDNPITFYMPENNVTLKATYYDSALVMGTNGKPDTSNAASRVENGKSVWYGTGWAYNGYKLDLTSGEWDFSNTKPADCSGVTLNAVKCYVQVGDNAVVKNGKFIGDLYSYGTIKDGTYMGLITNVGKIEGGEFDEEVVNVYDGSNQTVYGKIFGGLFRATVHNERGAIFGGIFKQGKPENNDGQGNPARDDEAISDGYTLTAENGTISYIYNEQEIDLGQSVYVVPNTNENDVLKVAGTGITEWDVVVGDDTYELTSWTGAQMQSGSKDTFVLVQGVVAQDATVTLKKHKAYNTALEIGEDGKPVTENRKPYGNGGVQGDGWTYIDGTLTLSGTFEFAADANTRIDCSVVVERGAKLSNAAVVGSNATVTNNGTITNCCFGNPGVTVINNGEISNSIFVKKPNGTGTLSGCLFASNDWLTDCWTVDLNYSDGETAYAGLQDNPFKMSVNKFYVIADASGKLPMIKLSKKDSNSSLPAQLTVTAPDGAQWTQNISGTDSFDLTIEQPTYTLTLVNAELVGMTGTEFTENTTIKIKPKFTDEELELDCWSSETTGFDVSSIYANGDGTYTLKMPGNALTLTANSRKKTYSLTVVNGYIGDATDIRSGSFEKGAQITLTQKVPEDKVFTGWELSDGLTLVDGYKLADATIKIKMPGKEATAKAFFKDKTPTTYTLTLTNATAEPAQEQYTEGQIIMLTAKNAAENKEFDKWILNDGLELYGEGKLTDKVIWVTITGTATATATYKDKTVTPTPGGDDDQPKTYTVTVKGGKINGETKVEGIAKGTKLTVDVDESEVPEGMTFDVWSIRFPEDVKDTLTGDPSVMLHDPHMSFAMPGADITIEAQYRSSELPGEDDGPSTLGTMATVAVGGAAAGILVWQGVSLGVDSYLQHSLPDGVPVPANRIELVKLLWETAGKPEAALPSLYSDVPAEEIELQKATRWAIDNGLVKPADDSDASRFDPDRYVTKYDVFGAWLKLKKLMK